MFVMEEVVQTLHAVFASINMKHSNILLLQAVEVLIKFTISNHLHCTEVHHSDLAKAGCIISTYCKIHLQSAKRMVHEAVL